jgi:hypothetical protein
MGLILLFFTSLILLFFRSVEWAMEYILHAYAAILAVLVAMLLFLRRRRDRDRQSNQANQLTHDWIPAPPSPHDPSPFGLTTPSYGPAPESFYRTNSNNRHDGRARRSRSLWGALPWGTSQNSNKVILSPPFSKRNN